MNRHELRKLAKILDKLELDAYIPYKNISGGFARAEVFNFDYDSIDVELTFGIQSDCENVVYTENFEINRETMEVIN